MVLRFYQNGRLSQRRGHALIDMFKHAVMKSRNSEERAKEVANVNKQLDAGRARCAKAILAKAMPQCRNECLARAGAM